MGRTQAYKRPSDNARSPEAAEKFSFVSPTIRKTNDLRAHFQPEMALFSNLLELISIGARSTQAKTLGLICGYRRESVSPSHKPFPSWRDYLDRTFVRPLTSRGSNPPSAISKIASWRY